MTHRRIEPTLTPGSTLKLYAYRGSGLKIYMTEQCLQIMKNLEHLSAEGGHEAFHAQTIVGAVNRLRSGSAPANSMIQRGRPSRRCVVYSGFEIEYEINHLDLQQTEVHVLNIRCTKEEAEEENRAGLRWVEHDSGDKIWMEEEIVQPQLKTSSGAPGTKDRPIKVGINGYCDGIRHAANILPSHIARGNAELLNQLMRNGFHLLYVPTSHNLIKAGWTSLVNMGRVWTEFDDNRVQAAQILAAHMQEAHRRGLYVEWTSHRGGSFVLTEAMKLLSQTRDRNGRRLDLQQRQKVFLSDYTSGLSHIDQARFKLNMDTSDPKWYNYNPSSLNAQLSGYVGTDEMGCSLYELLKQTPKEERGGKAVDVIFKGVACHGNKLCYAGLTMAMGGGLVGGALLALADAVVATIPSLNEEYHTLPGQHLRKLGNAIFNRRLR